MFRREFFSFLSSLPFLGFLKEPAQPKVQQLKMQIGTFKRLPRIRLWKLGSLEHGLCPSHETMQKLADILNNWDGKADLDLIWGPDISVEEFEIGEEDVNLVEGLAPKINIHPAEGESHSNSLTK